MNPGAQLKKPSKTLSLHPPAVSAIYLEIIK